MLPINRYRFHGGACAALFAIACGGPRVGDAHDFRDGQRLPWVATRSDCHQPAAASVSRADALTDVQALAYLLERGYAGYPVREKEGVRWKDLFQRLKDQIQTASSPLPASDFQRLLVSHLRAVRDNHLSVWRIRSDGSWDMTSASSHEDAFTADVVVRKSEQGRWLLEDGAELVSCEDHELGQLLRPTLTDSAQTELTASSATGQLDLIRARQPILFHDSAEDPEPAPLTCVFRRNGSLAEEKVPVRPLRISLTPRDPGPAVEWDPGPPARLRLRTLAATQLAQLNRLEEIGQVARQAPVFVLDVRRNGGGRDMELTSFFRALTDRTLDYPQIRQRFTEVALQGAMNQQVCLLARPSLDEATASMAESGLERLLDLADERDMPAPFEHWLTRRPRWEGLAKNHLDGTLIVVADRGCGSSCETALSYARQLSDVLVVGENTAGTGVFGEYISFRLPASGLWIGFGSKAFASTGRAVVAPETKGHLPDIWIDSDKPVELTRAIAAKLVGKTP